jgi:hypothetical protein
MAAGHGGQILVASSTAELVDGIDLIDLGLRRLRDLSEALQIYQVIAEGLSADFPPLKTVDTVPGNLPAPPTSFVGRDDQITELVALLGQSRLVTLTGVGGVGKTRLSIQVAAELTPQFADGVWFVELAPVADAAAVPDTVATALGVTPLAGMSVTDSLGARAVRSPPPHRVRQLRARHRCGRPSRRCDPLAHDHRVDHHDVERAPRYQW